MTTLLRRYAGPAAGLTLLAAATVGSATIPAPAYASAGRCAQGSGVTVVVDFGSLGGGTRIGCDADGGGKVGSSIVPQAGFPVTYVASQPGFVCRVSGLPGADQEDCGDTPPADAYWGLFWSDGKSAAWHYSGVGITALTIPEGGSIGLRWEDGGTRENPGAPPTPNPGTSPKPSPT